MRKFIFVLTPLLLCRCASIEKSVGLGVGIGAASGIAASQMAHYNTKGHVVLGIGGAIIGGAIAALLHKNQPETPASLPVTNIMKNNQPPLADAEKDVLLVPDKIEGDLFVEKHRIWSIKKPSRWELRDGESKEAKEDEGESNEPGE
jgi:hypothetical protein